MFGRYFAGADVNKKDNFGVMALHFVAERGFMDILELLVTEGNGSVCLIFFKSGSAESIVPGIEVCGAPFYCCV